MTATSWMKIHNPYIEAIKLQVRSRDHDQSLARNLRLLGHAMGELLVERLFLVAGTVRTPMGESVEGQIPAIPLCVIISKKDERSHFADGLHATLDGSQRGYIDFAGKRGPDVYKTPPLEIDLPTPRGQVHAVIVAKAAIAGGCTVVEMARIAINQYFPTQIVFTGAFYTSQGIEEIRAQFPQASFFVAGEPDRLNDKRMLLPGIGQLDERLRRGSDQS